MSVKVNQENCGKCYKRENCNFPGLAGVGDFDCHDFKEEKDVNKNK